MQVGMRGASELADGNELGGMNDRRKNEDGVPTEQFDDAARDEIGDGDQSRPNDVVNADFARERFVVFGFAGDGFEDGPCEGNADRPKAHRDEVRENAPGKKGEGESGDDDSQTDLESIQVTAALGEFAAVER